MNHELKTALRPVKRRIRRNRLLQGAAAGTAAGLSAAAGLQAVSFFVPIPDRGLWAASLAAAVAVLAAIGNALRPVKDLTAAEAADACGLEERAITALEGGEEPIRLRQRRDACEAIRGLDVKRIRPGSVKKALIAGLGCAMLLGALLLVPNSQDTAAETHKALIRTLQEGREAIARAAEEDEERMPDEKKSELRKITAELDRELGESRDAADVLVALDKAEQRLEQMRRQTAGDAADAADSMAGETGDGKDGNGQGGTAEENPSAGSTAQAGDGQDGTSSAGTPTEAQLKTLQALSSLQSAVNPSAAQMQANAALAGMQASQGNGGSGLSGMGGQGQGQQSGNGAGEGTTNEEQAGSGKHSNGHMQGTRDPRYKEVEYETIYDPEHIDKAKQDVATEEKRLNDEGSVQLETGPGRGSLAGDVPWSEALQEYADTEARSADRENLTVQERQWVNDYFSLLTEQK